MFHSKNRRYFKVTFPAFHGEVGGSPGKSRHELVLVLELRPNEACTMSESRTIKIDNAVMKIC